MNHSFSSHDGCPRCRWAAQSPDFIRYHDTEWGFPVGDDRLLFEKICLEGFQSGLSWRTILAKREGFRAAFRNFDYRQVARFTDDDVERLLQNADIVRNRGKIRSVVNNAKQACGIADSEGSLAAFLWRFEPDPREIARPQTASVSLTSIALSKELKKRGWSFVGPTTIYAFMQAMGLVNDHAEECFVRPQAEKARRNFKRPA